MDMMLGMLTSMQEMPWEKMFVTQMMTESNVGRFQETSSDVAATMRSLIKAQEEQH